MNSHDYWLQREQENLKIYIKEEAEYQKELRRIYQEMLDACQKDIESFYAKYAAAEGISLAEAKKRVSKHDVKAFERTAARYVKEKNFSKKANEELRLYNATMKINRLEMLKANIGLETIAGHDKLEKFMAGILKGRTEDELKRQAGILGKSIKNNAKAADAIVNGSFRVAKVGDRSTFSDRIWQYQDIMRQDLGKLLQQGLIQGKGARAIAKDLKKYWYGNDPKTGGGATYCMERLMRTELARVQTEAQRQSFERNGFDMYQFICNVNPTRQGTCSECRRLANEDNGHGKGVYLVKDMMPGTNAPPMHPHCRCSVAAWEDDEEYEAWLDYLDKGGTTAEWNEIGLAEWKKLKKTVENSKSRDIIKADKGIITAKAKKLPDAKERSRIINEAINAKIPVYADDLREAYKNVKPKDDFMDVCLHGTPYYTEYEHKYILDTETLYMIISGRKDYQKQKIRLMSCSTGKADQYGNCVAQQLANMLGVEVSAPIDVLNLHTDGSLSVGERPRLSEKDGFRTFTPQPKKGSK